MQLGTLRGVGAQLRVIFALHPAKYTPVQNGPAEALTAREQDVLYGLVSGLTNKQIAARLKISDRTVQYHIGNVLAKLGAASRTEAAVIALRLGLVAKP